MFKIIMFFLLVKTMFLFSQDKEYQYAKFTFEKLSSNTFFRKNQIIFLSGFNNDTALIISEKKRFEFILSSDRSTVSTSKGLVLKSLFKKKSTLIQFNINGNEILNFTFDKRYKYLYISKLKLNEYKFLYLNSYLELE